MGLRQIEFSFFFINFNSIYTREIISHFKVYVDQFLKIPLDLKYLLFQ